MLKSLYPLCSKKATCTVILERNPSSQCCRIHVRYKSTRKKNLYDVLEISNSATQKEVKAAFYRLSMKHHPDRNVQHANAPEEFRKVSEAYQTLSNPSSRKSYDAELSLSSQAGETSRDRGASQRRTMARTMHSSQARPPPPTGRSKIYNFDEFYRMHYGKAMSEIKLQKQKDELTDLYEHKHKENARNLVLAFYALFGFFALTEWYRRRPPKDPDGE